jgi:ppGpp synthetase/RelA/SpoT-type nucleotidyltranferase
MALSNTAIDAAGDQLRALARASDLSNPENLRSSPIPEPEWLALVDRAQRSFEVVNAFVDEHLEPMGIVFNSLAFFAAGTPKGVSSYRPKRLERIWEKLMRQPKMRLSQMEDVGGCRSVVPGLREVGMLAGLLMAQMEVNGFEVVEDTDYYQNPKASGYRARHIVVKVAGRRVEVQLRSERQEEWAQRVEDAGGQTGYNVKDGDAPEELLRYFERAAFRLALEERGREPDNRFQVEFAALREQVRPYFSRNR